MGHKRRIQSAGLYHVTARSNAEEQIFLDDGDYVTLITNIAATGIRCHVYCLMPTHYHLLVSVDEGELVPAIQLVNRRYAKAFNRRYGRHGHVFESPYTAVPVESDEYVYRVIVYIAANPERPETWRWSSFPATLHGRGQPSFVDDRLVHETFASTEQLRRAVAERVAQRG